jgi:hypothetical protein
VRALRILFVKRYRELLGVRVHDGVSETRGRVMELCISRLVNVFFGNGSVVISLAAGADHHVVHLMTIRERDDAVILAVIVTTHIHIEATRLTEFL